VSRNAAFVRFLLSTLTLAELMIACAGTARLPMMWIYLGVYWGLGFPASLIADVSLDAERRQPGPGGIDPVSRRAASLLFLATVAAAAFDAGRFHWTVRIPHAIKLAALAIFALALAVQNWALAANPFFSTAIRIQPERGHRLIGTGPYRFIRHPGYLAMAIIMPATALAIGSLAAMIPALGYSGRILWRTNREDEFLTEQLAGYADYAAQVRYRLIPRLW
jgi:protein-S-isoprenylcysteine O-methyltransferase Ste14